MKCICCHKNVRTTRDERDAFHACGYYTPHWWIRDQAVNPDKVSKRGIDPENNEDFLCFDCAHEINCEPSDSGKSILTPVSESKKLKEDSLDDFDTAGKTTAQNQTAMYYVGKTDSGFFVDKLESLPVDAAGWKDATYVIFRKEIFGEGFTEDMIDLPRVEEAMEALGASEKNQTYFKSFSVAKCDIGKAEFKDYYYIGNMWVSAEDKAAIKELVKAALGGSFDASKVDFEGEAKSATEKRSVKRFNHFYEYAKKALSGEQVPYEETLTDQMYTAIKEMVEVLVEKQHNYLSIRSYHSKNVYTEFERKVELFSQESPEAFSWLMDSVEKAGLDISEIADKAINIPSGKSLQSYVTQPVAKQVTAAIGFSRSKEKLTIDGIIQSKWPYLKDESKAFIKKYMEDSFNKTWASGTGENQYEAFEWLVDNLYDTVKYEPGVHELSSDMSKNDYNW